MTTGQRRARSCALLLLVALPLALLNAWLNPHRPPWQSPPHEFPFVTVAGLQVMLAKADVLMLDARSPTAFHTQHIPAALPLYVGNFDDDLIAVLDAWLPKQSLVIYCDDAECGSSLDIARRLRDDLGLDAIFILEGGWEAWMTEHGNAASTGEGGS